MELKIFWFVTPIRFINPTPKKNLKPPPVSTDQAKYCYYKTKKG